MDCLPPYSVEKRRFNQLKYRILLILCTLMLVLAMTGCGKDEETTLTGMVVSVDGTVISLQEFDGEMKEMPADGERPDMENFEESENFNPKDFDPEDFEGTMPELPEGEEIPEMPENGEMPDFSSRFSDGESTTIDLADAHISVEADGEKAAGSMDDITEGSFLTVTMNGKGEATNVVVSSMSGFGRGNSADQ